MYVIADKSQLNGNVTIHDKIIELIIHKLIFDLSPHFFLFKYSLNIQIQNIAHNVIWVEDTGSHIAEANSTVDAAAIAIQKALTWSIFVMSFHTVLISLGQNVANQIDNHNHHIIIIHRGTQISFHKSNQVELIVSYIAENGHIALDTSFDQWAKHNKDTATINGILNNLLTKFLSFWKKDFLRLL